MPPSLPDNLPLARYRFTARLEGDLLLPEYAGSLLRGVLGAALRRTACMTGLPACPDCPLWRSCPYPALFEVPPQPTQFGQQFSQVPNPYVIEPPPFRTQRMPLAAGEALVFQLVLVGAEALRQLPLVVHAWQRALRHGLGQARVPGELLDVEQLQPDGSLRPVLGADGRLQPHRAQLVLAELLPASPLNSAAPPTRLALDFTTPLRLQHNGTPLRAAELTPRTFVAHLLRRLSLMLELHLGVVPAPFDVAVLLAVAEALQHDSSALRWQDWRRYSARQRQDMALGGLVGRWTLHGELAPLLPWLALGQWLHVGKNATMGLGGYQMEIVDVVQSGSVNDRR
ncbi:MAG: hypothetical protein RLY71_2412 [Pseudomonadota bacterium]